VPVPSWAYVAISTAHLASSLSPYHVVAHVVMFLIAQSETCCFVTVLFFCCLCSCSHAWSAYHAMPSVLLFLMTMLRRTEGGVSTVIGVVLQLTRLMVQLHRKRSTTARKKLRPVISCCRALLDYDVPISSPKSLS
jgi:hypothetical protein